MPKRTAKRKNNEKHPYRLRRTKKRSWRKIKTKRYVLREDELGERESAIPGKYRNANECNVEMDFAIEGYEMGYIKGFVFISCNNSFASFLLLHFFMFEFVFFPFSASIFHFDLPYTELCCCCCCCCRCRCQHNEQHKTETNFKFALQFVSTWPKITASFYQACVRAPKKVKRIPKRIVSNFFRYFSKHFLRSAHKMS